jgi:hypothetical protein
MARQKHISLRILVTLTDFDRVLLGYLCSRIFRDKQLLRVIRQAIAQAVRFDPRFKLDDLLDYIQKEYKAKDDEQREQLLHAAKYFASSVVSEITSIDADNSHHMMTLDQLGPVI